MFDENIKFSGRHANYLKDLCVLQGNVKDKDEHANFKIFRAYVDAYITCPIIGYQYQRKALVDTSIPGDAGILAENLIKKAPELKFVYQILMLLDTDSEPDEEKRIYRAFNFTEKTDEDRSLIEKNMQVYLSYFLGGLEVLHEQFVDDCVDRDAYLQKMYVFSKQFYECQDGAALTDAINRILS